MNGKAVDNFQNGRPFTNRRRREAATHVHKRQKNRGVGLLFLCRIIESRNSSLASFPLPTDRRLFGDTGLDGGGHSAVVTGRLSRTRNGEKIGKEIFGGKKKKKEEEQLRLAASRNHILNCPNKNKLLGTEGSER